MITTEYNIDRTWTRTKLGSVGALPKRRTLERFDSMSKFLLFLIILIGAAVRFWKLDYGQPNFYFMDEAFHVYFALNFGGGDLNPHNFVHPTLYYYLCFLADVVFILSAKLAGYFKALSDAWALYKENPTVYFVLARGVSATLGVLTIPMVYFIGKTLFENRVGLMAALFLSLSYLHVQYSQVAYVDIALTFFYAAAFYMAALAYQSGKMRFFALAGLLAGLTSSTKYTGFAAWIFGPLAAVLFASKNRQPAFFEFIRPRVWVFLICAVAGFLGASPFILIAYPEFKDYVLQLYSFYKFGGLGHVGYEGSWNWFYYIFHPLNYGVGAPVAVAGWAGIIYHLIKRNTRDILFVSFPLVFLLIMGSMEVRTPRYVLAVIPFLCLAAAALVCEMTQLFSGRRKMNKSVLILLALLFILPSALNVARYNYLKLFPDTRLLAHRWVAGNVSKEAKMLQTLYGFLHRRQGFSKVERLDATAHDSREGHLSSLKSLADYRQEGFEYLILDEWHIGTALRAPEYRKDRIQISERYVPFLAALEKEAKLLAEFSPYQDQRKAAFDPENVEFASRSLWDMKTLGPRIRIYKL